jgi:endonuclease/exonuclease/phosphatase family metal-dependent hydrolase
LYPPGQVKVVTVNAHENPVLGIKRFRAMFFLSKALRSRPVAFNGGLQGAVAAPDVVITQEMRASNLEIFQHLLRQRFRRKYTIIGPDNSSADIIIDPDTVTLQASVVTWNDVCLPQRTYEIAHLTQNATGSAFTVAGVHFWKHYTTSNCLDQNVQQMQTLLLADNDPTIIGGDFNRRPVQDQLECDPNEESQPLTWWNDLTHPSAPNRVFDDAVRTNDRRHSISMRFDWTQEQGAPKTGCYGQLLIRRSRIDYLFYSGAELAEARTDLPGWAGHKPGTRNRRNGKYSDHRFVWGRFILSGPPQPDPPSATPGRNGMIHLAWGTEQGVTGWVLYRARGSDAYDAIAKLDPAATSYDDNSTENAVTYRYALAPVGANGGQGLESLGRFATADASGPDVLSVQPRPGAIGVDPGTSVQAFMDERPAPSSVGQDTIQMFLGQRRIGGFVRQASPRLIKFNPASRLKRGATYRVVVSGLKDRLGNAGRRYSWSFSTVAQPPRHKHRRR